jgi:hypothetical protein
VITAGKLKEIEMTEGPIQNPDSSQVPAIDVLQDYLPDNMRQFPVSQLGDNMPQPKLGSQLPDNMPTRLPAGLTQGATIAPPAPAPAPASPAAPPSAVDAIATMYFKHLLDRQPPPTPPAPGGFADKLRGALSGFQSSLGDAAAATTALPSGVGGLGGVERTLAARTNRLSEEKQRATENARAADEARQKSAMNAIQMSVHQVQLSKLDKELQDDTFNSNKVASKAREESGLTVNHGITEEQIKNKMANFKDPNGVNRHYTDAYDLLPVGRTDINGRSQVLYDEIQKTPDMVKPTEDERNYIAKNGGPTLSEDQLIRNDDLTSLRLQAQRTSFARQAIEDATGKELDAKKAQQLNADLHTPIVQSALSSDPEDKITGLMTAKQSADAHVQQFSQLLQEAQQHGDPAAIKEAQQHLAQAQQEKQSLDNVFTFGLSKEDLENHRKYKEDLEKHRHNIEEEKTAAKKAAGTEEVEPWAEGLTGGDYLEALQQNRPGDAGTVKAIGEGRQSMPPRLSKDGLRLSNMVNRAYPDWDSTLGKTWASTRNEYMGSGKIATFAVPSYNAALRHMGGLLENTTLSGVLDPTSQQYQRRQAEIGFVREELGKAVAAGVMAESDKKDFEDKLTGGLTPGLKRERIEEAARLLHDKLEEYQTKFEAAKPSAHINVPKLISPEAAKAFDYVLSGGKTAKPQSQGQTVAAPQGHKIGDTFMQNGHKFTVTSVDEKGNVTGAE